MYFNGDITFKGESSNDYSLLITTVPTVVHSEIRGEVFQIPGHDGDLHSEDTYRGDAEIRVSFALIRENNDYFEAIRNVRRWLTGTGRLIIGDATDSYYEVKKVVLNTDERLIVNVGTIEAVFTIYPYEFLNSGNERISGAGSISNIHSEAMPLYKIEGNGNGMLTVNSKQMTFTVSSADQGLYIDTRKFLAYSGAGANKNAVLSGDYEGLRLKTGENTISITNGFTLTTYPRWGYVI